MAGRSRIKQLAALKAFRRFKNPNRNEAFESIRKWRLNKKQFIAVRTELDGVYQRSRSSKNSLSRFMTNVRKLKWKLRPTKKTVG